MKRLYGIGLLILKLAMSTGLIIMNNASESNNLLLRKHCSPRYDKTQLLLQIKRSIGNVNQSPCDDTILGILGDACAILGPDISISEALKILIDCCDDPVTPTVDLSAVFTVLADIETELIDCCATLEQDFQNTWTILANLNLTATVDFSTVFTVLTDLQSSLNACCNGTFTALADIKSTIITDFQNTWTILADLKATETTCCNGTFTVLADIRSILVEIDQDLDGTFTVLADINDTLTTCCNGTFTVLADLKDTLTNCGIPIAITQELIPYTIATAGVYCLAEDVTVSSTAAITIMTSAVILDLNNHSTFVKSSIAI